MFEERHPLGSAISGNTSDPRVFYELDAFLGAARRIYESMRKVLWKHYGSGKSGRWKSIKTALESSGIIPVTFVQQVSASWQSYGNKLTEYRDCVMHNDPLTDGGTTCQMEWYGRRWGITVKLPANPGQKSRRSFDFSSGPEALTYCHEATCHLVDLCQILECLDQVRHHLDNPKL